MDIRPLSDAYAVSPQIMPEEAAELAAQGFTTVICNRPDAEVPGEIATTAMRQAVEAAGMRFVANPFSPGALTMDLIETQRAAIDAAQAAGGGKVFAYCASGNRSSILWALAMAGRLPTDTLIDAGAAYGYQAGQFRALIDKLAAEA